MNVFIALKGTLFFFFLKWNLHGRESYDSQGWDRGAGGSRGKRDYLDPKDPAAYSDVSR